MIKRKQFIISSGGLDIIFSERLAGTGLKLYFKDCQGQTLNGHHKDGSEPPSGQTAAIFSIVIMISVNSRP